MALLPRRSGIASVATLGGTSMILGIVHLAAPEWSQAAGLDVWNASRDRAVYNASQDRRAELERSHSLLSRQIAASDQVVWQLIDARVTLAAAADELQVINRDRDPFDSYFQLVYPDAPTPETRTARYAMGKAMRFLQDDPSYQAEVMDRLEAEYRDMVRHSRN